ncbi:MAG: hypothetical protein AAF581_23545 [Planctomycetota bacterium]
MSKSWMLVLAMVLAGVPAPLLAGDEEFKRERRPATAAAKDALEGKAPPKLVVEGWLNSKALTWSDLRGKVVVIDFWGTW